MNVDFLGVSTSQVFVVTTAVLSLLVFIVLLWKNHRDLVKSNQRVLVLVESGTVRPVNSVARQVLADFVRMPARAPPTTHFPSIDISLPGDNTSGNARDSYAFDSAD